MKRMNFTFLLLFALLSFATSNLSAQSSSCIDVVNITVDANGGFVVNPAVLGATGPAMTATSIEYGTGSSTALALTGSGFSGGGNVRSLFGSCESGTTQYELYQGSQMVCWGKINFEVKTTPDPLYNTWNLMCGQDGPDFSKAPYRLSDIATRVNGACSVTITNLTIREFYESDKCDGNTYIREVYGSASLDGSSRKVLLQEDRVVEMPIDLTMVLCPRHDAAGGTQIGTDSTLHIECGTGTDPASIAKFYDKKYKGQGAAFAYPHIVKPDVIDKITMGSRIDSIVIDTVATKIEIGGVWVLADVVTKDTFRSPTLDTTYKKVIVPIKKGVQCNLSTKCTDMYFAGCVGDESKIMRTWQTVDWCTGSVKECMQWIIVHDTKAPVYKTGLRADRTYYAPIAPWICSATLKLPVPSFWDDCSEYDLDYVSNAGTISGDYLTNLWITECPVTVTITATDHCGNEAVESFYVLPYDNVAPVAIATDQLNVSLTGDPTEATSTDGGIAKVYKESFDAGSHDAGCGEVETCVLLKEELANQYYWPADGPNGIRAGDPILINNRTTHIYAPSQCVYDGVWEYTFYKGTKFEQTIEWPYVICKDFVKFCCSDIFVEEEQNYQQVALVVTDQALICDYNGLEARHPNVSHSWTNVKVEDKSGAGWSCKNPRISCDYIDGIDWDHKDYKPYYGGIICNNFDVRFISYEEETTCGDGYVFVTYGAYGGADSDVLISQITCHFDVVNRYDFNPYEIKWPKHYDGSEYSGILRECEELGTYDDDYEGYKGIVEYPSYVSMGDAQDCAVGEGTGAPVWCNISCGLIGSSYELDTVSASDACYKLIKRWTVIDWCTWTPNDPGYRDGNYVYNNYYYEDAIPDDANDTYADQFEAVDDEWLAAAGYENAMTDTRIGGYYTGGSYDEHGTYTGGDLIPYPYCEDCEKPSGDADHVYFRYSRVDWDGYYTFDQVIKVIDDVDPEVSVEDSDVAVTDGNAAKSDDPDYSDCVGSETITASVTDMCGETDLSAVGASWWVERTLYDADGDAVSSATKSGTGATMTMSTGEGEPGWSSVITWRAKDGCGNTGYATSTHDFVDTKNPTPVCIQDLSTAAMNTDGSVSIWASDYDLGSFDNCSDVEVYFLDEDGDKVPSLDFTCDNLGTNELQMYVSDASNNVDYCYVTLRIDDNTGVCGDVSGEGAAAISGEVATASGDMVESAEVALSAGAKSATSIEGKYAFNNTASNNEYQVRAKKNDDYMNGVSTLDLVLIQKHVLGLQTLDSPYKVIAADINSDENISAIDLVELRKLILGIYTELPNNDSWRFVDATQSFDEVTSPFPFAEQLSVSLGTNDVAGQNFVAAKIGDVSGNAIANSAIASDNRSLGTVKLQIADATVGAGELVNVAVSANAFNNVAAYQFTMDLAGLEFVSVASGAVEMTEANFGILDNNTITAAWYNTSGVTTEDALFTVTFRATSAVTLSKAIALSSRVTKSVAYTAGAESLDLGLEFNSKKVSTFALYQNEPNPFNDATLISFELPEAGQATLNVFDVTGKTVLVRTENFAKGSNQIELRKAELNTTGVMYYQLESGDFTATKKMILID